MSDPNVPSSKLLFSRRQRRALAGAVREERCRAALDAAREGDGSRARDLLALSETTPTWRERLLEALVECEAKDTYAAHGVRPRPGHAEYGMIRDEARARLESSAGQEPQGGLKGKLPAGIWDCAQPGPLAERLCETLSVCDLSSAHMWALAERPDSQLGELARQQLFDELRWSVRGALRYLGCDDGTHGHATRIPGSRELHLLAFDGEKLATRCGRQSRHYAPVEREEAGPRLADHPDACRTCLEAAERDGARADDARPPAPLLDGRDQELRQILLSRFSEAARSLPQDEERRGFLLDHLLADPSTRAALCDALVEIFERRLPSSGRRLRDLNPAGLVQPLHFGDPPVSELLVGGSLRAGVRRFVEQGLRHHAFDEAIELAAEARVR